MFDTNVLQPSRQHLNMSTNTNPSSGMTAPSVQTARPPILRGQQPPIPLERFLVRSIHQSYPLENIELPNRLGSDVIIAPPDGGGGSSTGSPATSAFPEIPQSMDGAIPTISPDLETPVMHVSPIGGSHILVQAGAPPASSAVTPIMSDIYDPTYLLHLDDPNFADSQIIAERLRNDTSGDAYRRSVQEKLTSGKKKDVKELKDLDGYVDEDGYVVEWQKESNKAIERHALGEATYFTAIAIVALASPSYQSGSWEAQNANKAISKFLDVLENKSWGNIDGSGWSHPIRHPAWFEYYGTVGKRNRPMSRDAFNQIVLACYYAYKCTHGSPTIQQQAQSLLQKWVNYLAAHSSVLHSNFIQGEFEKEEVDGKSRYTNLFANKEHTERITAAGPETYTLWSHELWALRNCAIALGIPHLTIVPALDLGTKIEELYILPFIRQGGDAIERLYDILHYEKDFSLDLIPNWKKSRVSGTFSVGLLPSIPKKLARNLFERALRGQLLLIFETHSDFKGVIGRSLQPLKEFFFAPELLGIVEELLSELLQWADPVALAEMADFLLALQIGKATYKPDSAGYTFWAFIMELEARPHLRIVLEPLALDYFTHLVQKDNANGLWAWIAGRNDVVAQHLALFESQEEDHWVHYAYGENPYKKWTGMTKEKEPKDETKFRCCRVDYLVLKNLAQRGLPEIPPTTVSFKTFFDFAEKLFQLFIESVLRDALGLGYVRDFLDALGNTVREIFTSDAVEQVIRLATGDVIKNVFRLSGEVEQAVWAADGTFRDLRRYAKIAEDGLVDVADLVESQIRALDGTLEIWNWNPGKVLTQYAKYIGIPASGATSEVLRTVLLARDSLGAVSQWVHDAGVLRTFTQWSSSDISGHARAAERSLQMVRSATGELLQWTFHPDGALKEFSRWLTSSIDGAAEGIDMAFVSLLRLVSIYWSDVVRQHALRKLGGQLDVIYWTGGVFQKSLSWAVSTVTGASQAINCTLLQLRMPDGIFDQWELANGEIARFMRWQRSTVTGVAEAIDQTLRIEREGEKIVKHVFKEGVAVASQILDAAGNVLSDVVDAIGGFFKPITHWHW